MHDKSLGRVLQIQDRKQSSVANEDSNQHAEFDNLGRGELLSQFLKKATVDLVVIDSHGLGEAKCEFLARGKPCCVFIILQRYDYRVCHSLLHGPRSTRTLSGMTFIQLCDFEPHEFFEF